MSAVRRVYVGGVQRVSMARPEVDDEILEMADEICQDAVTVPLPASELSANQQLRIVVSAVYETVEDGDEQNHIDYHYRDETA